MMPPQAQAVVDVLERKAPVDVPLTPVVTMHNQIVHALSRGTIQWAAQHDWYLATTLCGTGVICRDYDSELVNGVWHHEPIEVTFYDRTELRAWAGY